MPLSRAQPLSGKRVSSRIPEPPISPFEEAPHLVVGVGADMCHSGPEAPTTEDTLKASLSDLESKRAHLNQNSNPQMLTKTLEVQNQVVPVNVHPALTAMGMDTSILSRPLQLAGWLQHFLSNWKLLTQDQFILEMVVGIQIPFTTFPHQNQVPPLTFHNQSEKVAIDREISEMLQKGAIQVVSPMNEEFLSSVFLVKKKDGGNRPVINLKFRVEFLCNLPTFQNGGSVFTETFSSDWGLDDKNRFERCLLYCASKQSTSTPFAFHAWRPEIPIFLPPLRVRTCPSPFYEALEACCCSIKETRSETDHLSRRHYCFQSDSGGHCEGQGLNPLAAPASRLCDQLKKSVLHPAQSMEYLGFVISSLEMNLFLPPGKMSQLVQDCKDLILEKSASVRTLSQIIGKLTSTMQAVLPAPLHYRHLQMLQVKGLLEGKEYNSVVPLNMECRNDLQWWIDQLSIWNGRSLISPAPDLIITTDASLKGWGAVSRSSYQGTLDPGGILTAYKCPRTQGSSFCLESFLQESKETSCPSPNGQQNSSCIPTKNGGDTVSGTSRDSPGAMGICSEEGNFPDGRILARGVESRSDWQSRHFRDSSNWKLNPKVFHSIDQLWGPLTIDLFADRMNTQLRNYVSWLPDPFAQATDAFQIPWSNLKGYCFPPFSLICRCLAKIRKDQGTMVLIAPTCHAQAWYPVLLETSCRHSILLPPLRDLLLSPNHQPHPLVLKGHLKLAAWMVTGKTCLQVEFQKTLQICSAPIRGGKGLQGLTTAPGNSGVAGVANGRLIHLATLWPL